MKANQQQLDLLKQGVTENWNSWRLEYPGTQPELQAVDLTGANLGGVDLANADLSGADLSGASLVGADLTSADLNEANLTSANVRAANSSWTNVAEAIISAEQLKLARSPRDDF